MAENVIFWVFMSLEMACLYIINFSSTSNSYPSCLNKYDFSMLIIFDELVSKSMQPVVY